MPDNTSSMNPPSSEIAVFGTGCFWCSEAVFTELKGVLEIQPGYMGGDPARASYKAVCEGNTGHAEVSRITFDPQVISFDQLLEVFWKTHDPTSLNRQGGDVGTQYRSAIFFTDEEQKTKALAQRARLDKSGAWEQPIVTEVVPVEEFFPAENNHHDYFANNPEQGYCRMVIQPKMEKFRKAFKDQLK